MVWFTNLQVGQRDREFPVSQGASASETHSWTNSPVPFANRWTRDGSGQWNMSRTHATSWSDPEKSSGKSFICSLATSAEWRGCQGLGEWHGHKTEGAWVPE